MKDRYFVPAGFPAEKLVDEKGQPDFPAIDCPEIGPSSNIAYHLSAAQVAAGRAEEIAVIDAGRGARITFAALDQRTTSLARAMVRQGLRTGDRVAYRSTNIGEAIVVMLATWKAGCVVVPIPAAARATELGYMLEDTKPRWMFALASTMTAEIEKVLADAGVERVVSFGLDAGAGMRDELAALLADDAPIELPRVECDQPAIVWHTGGTTGRPKPCYHTHRRFLLAGFTFGCALAPRPGQRWAAAAPIGHALGVIHNTIFCLLHGAAAVMVEQFHDPAIMARAIDEHGITTLTALMPSWARIAEYAKAHPEAHFRSLRRCYAMWQSASASTVFDYWRDRGIELYNNFGSTSFANWVLAPYDNRPVPQSALGYPLPGYEVEAVRMDCDGVEPVARGEIGRLAVRGPTGLTYWGQPALQARDVVDGWTLCDDLIRIDDHGCAHYMGRSDNMISTGGFKVAPVEVEEVLSRHPGVREVAVVPAPDALRQEVVVAFVALHASQTPTDALAAELQAMVKAELSSYKVPRFLHFIDALPRDAVGKVQSKIVKSWALERHASGS